MRFCLSLLLLAAPLAAAGPPNVVLIYADDLGWTDLGCFGSSYYETPHIDRLAREGIRFTRYYTSPNCAPSRAALMTGQYAPRTGVYTVASAERGRAEDRALEVPENVTDLPLDREILADVLRRGGYRTAIFGKWHLGFEGGHFPTERGFDEAQVVARNAYYDFTTIPPVEEQGGQYLTDYLTDRAVDFLRRHTEERFFLYLPHLAVHTPIVGKADYVAAWEERAPQGTHWHPTYAAMVQSLDESVGRVLDTLDELGLAESTLVIFTSDNGGLGGYYRTEAPSEERGFTDNAPLRGGKGTLYEGGVRVPLIARWPGHIDGGTETDTPIAHIDMLPTLSAIAEVEGPKHTMDGVNIGGLFRGEADAIPPRPDRKSVV